MGAASPISATQLATAPYAIPVSGPLFDSILKRKVPAMLPLVALSHLREAMPRPLPPVTISNVIPYHPPRSTTAIPHTLTMHPPQAHRCHWGADGRP